MMYLLLWLACAKPTPTSAAPSEPDPAPAPLPSHKEMSLGIGETDQIAGMSVTVRSIEDSRCPINARCITAGDAVVTLDVDGAGGAGVVTLHTSAEAGSATAAAPGGTSITLRTVEPMPQAGSAPKPPQVATLQVGSAP